MSKSATRDRIAEIHAAQDAELAKRVGNIDLNRVVNALPLRVASEVVQTPEGHPVRKETIIKK